MRTVARCILLVTILFAGLAGKAQPGRIDTFVLHFAFDHSDIRPVDTGALRAFISSDLDSLNITGFTDTVGTETYNQQLSLRRALSVAALFRQWLGSDSNLLTRIDARGEANPLPGDDSGSRRVVIVCWHRPALPPPPPPPPVVAHIDTPRDLSQPDTVFELEDIRFHANTAVLTDAAQLILPKYIDYLLTLRDRYLEVDGYCNSPGPPLPKNDPLYILSVKRAKFIYDALIEKGFDSKRLLYKGKGNTNPRNAHPTTRDQMDSNMRVEIRVFRQKPEP